MSTNYFGFAVADSMFPADCTIKKSAITPEQARELVRDCKMCLNPSHKATIEAARKRFGIEVEIPEKPARIELGIGDSVLVMGIAGLPRLTDRHEYTAEEVAKATFKFSLYTVL